jgi:AraC-like DNA-binding protein
MPDGKPGAGMAQLIETTDLETTHHILSATYGSMHIDARGERRGMKLEQASLGPVQLHHVSFAMSFDADATPLGALIFGQLISGLVRHGSDRSDRFFRPGQVFFAVQPEHPYTATIEDTEVELAVLDPALPSQVAGTAPGRGQQPVRFTGYEPVSARAAQGWRDTYAYLRDVALTLPDGPARPLVSANAARLLAATALATFPSNALTDPTIEDRHDAHPGTLRRAVAFIDEHAHQVITVADIAAAAFVTIRAVQLAFRRHLDITPMEYLRRVRLDHAHRDLLAAVPPHESVTAVAYRWGFSSPSRFAAAYRQAYGVTPNQTLHQE